MAFGLDVPPTWFDAEKRVIWHEIVQAAPVGLLLPCDRWAIELLVTLIIRCRSPHALRGDFVQTERMLSKCGLEHKTLTRMLNRASRRKPFNTKKGDLHAIC